ncbi:MAG: C10 family peptidase, partial [Muribaculaceae bacterium]|nr:C10 family peptidase [Muribaculaceae bacterium]
MFKNLLKISLAGVALAVGFVQADAVPLSPDQALQRLTAEGPQMLRASSASSQYKLAYTESTKTGLQTVYIFSRGANNGFIITSADDRFPAVLGYSDNGTFDYTSAPPAFKWWIEQYSQEAEWYIANADNAPSTESAEDLQIESISSSQSPRKASRYNVAPLVTTVWNQSAPFNNDCPLYNGSRSVTGCVATAMAQVINYHKYPEHGVGSHSYTHNGQTMSFDYANTTFDWANMLDNYNGGTGTDAQKAAVANLMYACGVSVNMLYSPSESGSFGSLIPYALSNYFNFSKDVSYVERNCYSAAEWEDLIYGELSASRPVIFGGQADGGGHEFVCDGYRTSDNFFHFNWGWGGYCDGYFILSNLEPNGQGIGGYSGGYNRDQHAVVNIKKPSGSNLASNYVLSTSGGLQATNTTVGYSTTISFSNNGHIGNPTLQDISLPVVMKITSQNNTVTYSSQTTLNIGGGQINATTGSLSYYISRNFNLTVPTGLAAGQYKMTLAYIAPDGSYQDVPFQATANSYLNMTVGSDNSVTFTTGIPRETYDISVTELYPTSVVTSGTRVIYYIYAKNNSSSVAFNDNITIKVCQKGSTSSLYSANLTVSMAPSGYAALYIYLTLNLSDGLYDILCYDPNGTQVGGPFPLTIGNVTEPTDITLDMTQKELTVGDEFTLTATVAPDDAADKTVTWTSSKTSVATVSNTGVVKAIAVGSATITATTSNGKTATCVVTVKAATVPDNGVTLDVTQ